MSDCPCCRHSLLLPLYAVESIPAFQNKVHDDPDEARTASTGRVDLVQCAKCGFVFNAAFDPGLMDYDPGYQNEQAHSPLFQGHLEAVAGLIMAEAPPPRRVVEIGCGKGFVRDHSGLLVWGAGAKGAAFVNLTDPDRRHVAALVDINPKKQGRFVSGTGHPIIDPRSLENHRGRLIVVTNSNYLAEIEAMTKNLENTLIPLEHLL